MPDQALETRIVTLRMESESGDLNATAAAVGNVIDRLDDLEKLTQKWEKQNEKIKKQYTSMLPQINKISRGIDSVHGAARKAASAIGTIGDALGAGGITVAFASGTKAVIEYNKQLIGLSAQYAKYGKGITEVENRMLGLGKKLSLTRHEVMNLYKTLEQGLPNASLAATEKILTNIRKVVGSNEQAISDMASKLISLASTYPSLQKSIERMDQLDKKRLNSVIKMELAAGRMSLQQAKGLSDYVSMNKQVSKVDDEKLKKSNEMVIAQQKMKKLYEEILFKIGGAILPTVQWLAKIIEENKDTILKVAEYFGKWIAPLLLAKSIIGGMVGSIGSLTKGMGGMFSGLKGLGGRSQGNKVFVTNWPASMKVPGSKAGGWGLRGGASKLLGIGMAGIAGYHAGGAVGRGAAGLLGLGKRGTETAGDIGDIGGAALAGGMVGGPIGAAVAAAGAAIWKFAKILNEFNKAQQKEDETKTKNFQKQREIAEGRKNTGELSGPEFYILMKSINAKEKTHRETMRRENVNRISDPTGLVGGIGEATGMTGVAAAIKSMSASANKWLAKGLGGAAGAVGSKEYEKGFDNIARELEELGNQTAHGLAMREKAENRGAAVESSALMKEMHADPRWKTLNAKEKEMIGFIVNGLKLKEEALKTELAGQQNRKKQLLYRAAVEEQYEKIRADALRKGTQEAIKTAGPKGGAGLATKYETGLSRFVQIKAEMTSGDVQLKKLTRQLASGFGAKAGTKTAKDFKYGTEAESRRKEGINAKDITQEMARLAAKDNKKLSDYKGDERRELGAKAIQTQLGGIEGGKSVAEKNRLRAIYDQILATTQNQNMLGAESEEQNSENLAIINTTRISREKAAAQVDAELGYMDALISKMSKVGETQEDRVAFAQRSAQAEGAIQEQISHTIVLRKQALATIKMAPKLIGDSKAEQQQIVTSLTREQTEYNKLAAQKKKAIAELAAVQRNDKKTRSEINEKQEKLNSINQKESSLYSSILTKQKKLEASKRATVILGAEQRQASADVVNASRDIVALEQKRFDLVLKRLNLPKERAGVQAALTGATSGRLTSRAEQLRMGGMTGAGAGEVSGLVDTTVQELQSEAQAYQNLADKVRKEVELEQGKAKPSKQGIKRLLTEERQALDKVSQALLKMRGAREENIKSYQEEVSLKEKSASLTEAEIGIMDNYMMGVKASAQLRLKLASEYASQEDSLMKQIRAARKEVAATAGGPNQIFFQKKLMDLEKQRLGVIKKMADVTKVLRDGWIGAINAMTVGSGRISKIVMTQTKNTGLMVQHLNIIRTGKSGAIRRAGEKGQVGRGGGVKFGTSQNTFTDSRGRFVSDFGTSAYKMDRGFSLSRQEYERTQGKHAAGVVGRRFSKDVRGRAARLGVGSAGEMLGASGQQGRMGVHAEGRVGRGGGGQKGLTPGEQRGLSPNKALYVEDQATKALAKKLGVDMGAVGGPGTPKETTGARSWDRSGEAAKDREKERLRKVEAEKAKKVKKETTSGVLKVHVINFPDNMKGPVGAVGAVGPVSSTQENVAKKTKKDNEEILKSRIKENEELHKIQIRMNNEREKSRPVTGSPFDSGPRNPFDDYDYPKSITKKITKKSQIGSLGNIETDKETFSKKSIEELERVIKVQNLLIGDNQNRLLRRKRGEIPRSTDEGYEEKETRRLQGNIWRYKQEKEDAEKELRKKNLLPGAKKDTLFGRLPWDDKKHLNDEKKKKEDEKTKKIARLEESTIFHKKALMDLSKGHPAARSFQKLIDYLPNIDTGANRKDMSAEIDVPYHLNAIANNEALKKKFATEEKTKTPVDVGVNVSVKQVDNDIFRIKVEANKVESNKKPGPKGTGATPSPYGGGDDYVSRFRQE